MSDASAAAEPRWPSRDSDVALSERLTKLHEIDDDVVSVDAPTVRAMRLDADAKSAPT